MITFADRAAAQSTDPLPPVVVEGEVPKKKVAKKSAPAPEVSQSAEAQPEPVPSGPVDSATGGPPNQSAPGLNLSKTGSSGSRLGLTPLETPASVDVISGETARERGQFSTVEAVAQNAPGFSSVAMPVLGTAFAARGFQGNNSVMQLYDGTRLFPGRGSITFPFNMWSVERIEVLHGPASVLYGDGAIGGIINVIPKKPITEGMFNEAQVFFDSNMTRRASLDSGGAISKNVSYRFNVSGDASDGWVDRGESENLGISGALRWQATSDLVFTLSHDYGDQEPMKYFGTPYRNGVFDKRTKDNNYNVRNAMTEFQDSWTQFKTEWEVNDSLSFRNVAYYLDSRREFRNAEDYLWGYMSGPDLVDREGIHIRQKQEQIGNRFDATVRTSLAGIGNETVVGFDVNRAKFGYASYFAMLDPVDPYDPDPGLFPNPDRLNPGFASELDQKSLFVEDRIIFNQYLSVVGGVRWDSSTLTRDDLQTPANGFEKEFNSFNWRVGAVVTPVRDLAFFGQYSVATDPLDVPLLDYAKDISNLKQTTGRQYEIGVKQTLWNGAFEWSLAAYDIVKNDLLVRDYGTFPPSLTQIGQQSSRGIEAAIGIELGRGWRVDANGALLKAQYDEFSYIDFSTFGMVDYSGKVPLLVPEKTGNIWLTWDFAAGWRASAGLQYVGEAFANYANTIERPAYTVVNAGLQWKPTDKMTLDFRIKNLFDEVYAPYVRSYPFDDNMVQGWIAPPRTFEASMSVRF
ncbi:TonB-dependent siderophore receptor [Hyphomicrobium sp.]|uniref:TonB-dependent siderophore receptor n=1 Tax=Hyphomicrobium sp. TaxID=82 RepID=UPI002E348733|nr:TonB-dependent siderophore receptor [Hyphomicrobium sp.]HEX2841010.1 TonB-dependent siderophore receptor [Hyphomicrobium sp.]